MQPELKIIESLWKSGHPDLSEYELLFEVHDYLVYHNVLEHVIFRKADGKTYTIDNDDRHALNAVLPEHLMKDTGPTRYYSGALEMNKRIAEATNF